jgi:PhnB protein
MTPIGGDRLPNTLLFRKHTLETQMAAKPIPDGYHTLTPYLIVKGAANALDYYKKAFAAKELLRMPGPDGAIMHAEMQVGDSPIMLADEMPGRPYRSPISYGGTPVSLMLYVEDVDAFFSRAIAAGGKVQQAVQDQFYGDRTGTFEDPFGHVWTIATHKEDVSGAEMMKRMEALMKQQGQK